ncbi:hypothetical protein SUGI_0938890 [Cryptomeria japonica]|nr:hypothetical protein SUGI_0938890 [Cryptomeria japonica]
MVGLCALLSDQTLFSPLSLLSSLVCLSSRPVIISGGLSLSREARGKLVDGATPSQHTNRHLTDAEIGWVLTYYVF